MEIGNPNPLLRDDRDFSLSKIVIRHNTGGSITVSISGYISCPSSAGLSLDDLFGKCPIHKTRMRGQ